MCVGVCVGGYMSRGQAEGGGQKLDPGGPFITYT